MTSPDALPYFRDEKVPTPEWMRNLAIPFFTILMILASYPHVASDEYDIQDNIVGIVSGEMPPYPMWDVDE